MIWQTVPLSELVKDLTNERRVIIEDDDIIRDPTIISKIHKINLKEEKKGSEVKIKKRVKILKGDLIFSKLHTQNGSFAYSNEEFTSTTTFLPLKVDETKINKNFLFWELHLQVPRLYKNDGVGRETYKAEDILGIQIRMPIDIKEQKRIVNVLDEIDKKCKEIQSIGNQNEDYIKNLIRSILQEAVEGKLVSQDPNDEPASVLIDKIRKEKDKIIKEKKRKEKLLPPISEEEIPYELPKGWEWIRVRDIYLDLRYGTSKKCNYNSNGTPVLRIPNLIKGSINVEDLKYAEFEKGEYFGLKLEEGDFLIIRSNGASDLVGRSCVVDKKVINFAYAGYLIRLRFPKDKIFSRYIYYCFESRLIRNLIEKPIRVSNSVKNVNGQKISNFLVPLPPLREQKRIVKKIDQLMNMCNEMKKEVKESQNLSKNLMECVLQEAFEK